MKKIKILFFTLLVISMTFFIYQNSFAGRADDPITIKGVFTDLTRPVIKMQSDAGTEYQVHIGPFWYWEDNGYSLQLNTTYEVFGIPGTGTNEILAYKITSEDKTIKLTDDNNNPLWWNSGNRKGRCDGWGNRNSRGNGRGPGNGTGNCWRK